MQVREGLRRQWYRQNSCASQHKEQFLQVSFHSGILWLLIEPVESLRDAGGGIGDGLHRAVAGDAGQALPVRRREGIDVLRRVSFSRLGLEREDEVSPDFGWSENDGCGLNPKAALNGKARAARHGGKGLGDGAAQLKPRAAAERRATAGDHAARYSKSRTALGEC